MAGNSTISIAFKLDGDDKGFKDLAKSSEGLGVVMTSTLDKTEQLHRSLVRFSTLSKSLEAVQKSIGQVQAAVKTLVDAYSVQEVAERKLTTVMRQRMGATDEEVDSIRELAKEQQKLGVIGDEVQLSGAQQMATYLSTADSIKTLIPAMNDLIAQQDGLNATTGSAEAIAKAMGKAMEGQVGSLQRLGITFTDAETNVMKFGTEEERAAVLAEVIESSVGGMNAALAATDSGKQAQLANRIGDVKERMGEIASRVSPWLTIASECGQAVMAVTTLSKGLGTLLSSLSPVGKAVISATTAVAEWGKNMALATAYMVKHTVEVAKNTAALVANKTAALAVAAAQKVASAATKVWSGIQAAFNAIMSANPIALVVLAIGALVAAVVTAYRNCEGFRNIVNKVWEVIKKFVGAIVGTYVKAFQLLAEGVKKVVDWFKELFKFNGKKVKVEAEVSDKSGKRGPDTGDLRNKYSGFSGGDGEAAFNAEARTLKEIADNISYYQKQLEGATAETAAEINKQIEYWQGEENAIRNAGKAVKETSSSVSKAFVEFPKTIRECDDNIAILTDELNNTSDAAVRAAKNLQIEKYQALADEWKAQGKAGEDVTRVWYENAQSIAEVSRNLETLRADYENAVTDEERARIRGLMDDWQGVEDAMRAAGDTSEDTSPKFDANATTLRGISDNISYLQDMLQTVSVDEAAWINKSIDKWNEKADAIRNAGKEEEKAVMKASDAMRQGYSQTKNLAGGIQGISDALNENGTVWDKITGVIDSFLQIFDSVTGIIDIIKAMTQATTEQSDAEEQQGIIAAATSAQKIAAAGAEASADMAQAVAADTAATGEVTEAAAETFSAHASIPFVGIAMAAASVAAMIATMLSMPKLAKGGLATGPTLAMVGEYGGASSNPEVIAPLDKLRSMLKTDDDRYGQVEFKIKGQTLVGVLNRQNNLSSRR